MVGILFMLSILGLAGAAIGIPAFLIRRQRLLRDGKRRKMLTFIRTRGTPDQVKRLEELERREIELQLKLLEYEQVKQVLDSPKIRSRLEGACIDVEELKRVLSGPEDDPILEAFEELEHKLLEEGKERQ